MKLIALLLAITLSGCMAWSKADIAREATYVAIHMVDWGQTRDIAKNPDKYHEKNPILGEHPSTKEVDRYMAASLAGHILITSLLPSNLRPYWQYGTIAFSGYLVVNNHSIGLRMSW